MRDVVGRGDNDFEICVIDNVLNRVSTQGVINRAKAVGITSVDTFQAVTVLCMSAEGASELRINLCMFESLIELCLFSFVIYMHFQSSIKV